MVSVFGGDISLENERRDNNRIQRRRERDEARRRKLLNAKTRLMGVDTNALDIQVEEKKRRKAAEAAAEQAYANSISQIKNLLEERNLMDNEEAIEEAIKTRAVWDVQQQQTTERSTFDLNDPNELKKRPKWTDADVVGPSSMRRFAGEDLFAGDRKKIQASQMKDWCTQIESEKRIKKEKEKQEMLRHSNYLMQVDQIRNEMNKIECEQRMSDNFKTAETNAQLVEMRKAERQAEKEQNILLNKMQSDKIQNDPMLCESRSQGKSVIEGRVRRDHWKGMTVSQLQAIQAENYQVILEKQDRMARERDAEVSFLFFLFFKLFCFLFGFQKNCHQNSFCCTSLGVH
tara:strand:- start:40 stop:1074 length:1035 start_codon:yes stop_codon:yes gene_type:complete